jgi:hypothetical protein
MEEHQSLRRTDGEDVFIKIDNAAFSWGFRVKEG